MHSSLNFTIAQGHKHTIVYLLQTKKQVWRVPVTCPRPHGWHRPSVCAQVKGRPSLLLLEPFSRRVLLPHTQQVWDSHSLVYLGVNIDRNGR